MMEKEKSDTSRRDDSSLHVPLLTEARILSNELEDRQAARLLPAGRAS
jgi:hypothetical protein